MLQASGEKIDTMTKKDAALFPIIASCALFGLYIVFTVSIYYYLKMMMVSDCQL